MKSFGIFAGRTIPGGERVINETKPRLSSSIRNKLLQIWCSFIRNPVISSTRPEKMKRRASTGGRGTGRRLLRSPSLSPSSRWKIYYIYGFRSPERRRCRFFTSFCGTPEWLDYPSLNFLRDKGSNFRAFVMDSRSLFRPNMSSNLRSNRSSSMTSCITRVEIWERYHPFQDMSRSSKGLMRAW